MNEPVDQQAPGIDQEMLSKNIDTFLGQQLEKAEKLDEGNRRKGADILGLIERSNL